MDDDGVKVKRIGEAADDRKLEVIRRGKRSAGWSSRVSVGIGEAA